MSENTSGSTSKAPKPVGLYPHTRRAGNLLFLSGVGPRTAGSDATDSEVPGLIIITVFDGFRPLNCLHFTQMVNCIFQLF